jgi:hypothetical protein
MIYPKTHLKLASPEVGLGVFAAEDIPKGTITWVKDPLDRVFSPQEVEELGPLFDETLSTYSYRDRNGDYVFCWDNGRFVNHSFNANCMTTAYGFEVAIRDIKAGEELCDDYGYLNIDVPFDAVPEDGSDRSVVYPDDLLRYHEKWDELILDALRLTPELSQLLRTLISDDTWDEIVRVSKGEAKKKSILECYYDRQR